MSTELPFPVYLPNCQIIDCQPQQEGYSLLTHSTDYQAKCPSCQQISSRLHGFYYRKPADLPVSDKQVQLRLRLRRFRCLNPACPKRTFGQSCPDWLPAFARRTNRLAHAQQSVAMMLGGQAGARLLTHIYMPTSHATIRWCDSSENGNRATHKHLMHWVLMIGLFERQRYKGQF